MDIDPELLRQLEIKAAARGLPDAQTLVNRILKGWLERAELARLSAMHTRVVAQFQVEGAHKEDTDADYQVILREIGRANTPRKYVYIRCHRRDLEDADQKGNLYSFPVGGTAWVRDSLLPWLAESLTEVERAHRADVSENRRKGHERRANRTDLEKTREAEDRRDYSERYGKERWRHARSQATSHRGRAERRGLVEHFSAVEWLDRAASHQFKCSECRAEAPLETHHRRALASGGTNTMENIVLLCEPCHDKIPILAEDAGEEWLAAEYAKMSLFKVGDKVRRAFGDGALSCQGEIVEVIPPVKGSGPMWCIRVPLTRPDPRAGQLLLHDYLMHDEVASGYAPTQFRVLWTHRKSGKQHEEVVPPVVLFTAGND